MVDRYNYPLLKCGILLLGMIVSYAMYDAFGHFEGIPGGSIALALVLWFGWFVILFGSFLRQLGTKYSWLGVKNLASSSRENSGV